MRNRAIWAFVMASASLSGCAAQMPPPPDVTAPPPPPPSAVVADAGRDEGTAKVEVAEAAVPAASCAVATPQDMEGTAAPDPADPFAERRASEALDRLGARVHMSEERRGRVLTLGSDELVEPGQWALVGVAHYQLDHLAPALREQGNHRIVVHGHTDSLGAAAQNDALSLRRAQAVCDYLVTRGVRVAALRVEGHGARRPAADNGTPEGRAQNRRIEIVVMR